MKLWGCLRQPLQENHRGSFHKHWQEIQKPEMELQSAGDTSVIAICGFIVIWLQIGMPESRGTCVWYWLTKEKKKIKPDTVVHGYNLSTWELVAEDQAFKVIPATELVARCATGQYGLKRWLSE